jgi:hypothetical protein
MMYMVYDIHQVVCLVIKFIQVVPLVYSMVYDKNSMQHALLMLFCPLKVALQNKISSQTNNMCKENFFLKIFYRNRPKIIQPLASNSKTDIFNSNTFHAHSPLYQIHPIAKSRVNAFGISSFLRLNV